MGCVIALTVQCRRVDCLSSIPLRTAAVAAMLHRIPKLLPTAYIMEWYVYARACLIPSVDLVAATSSLEKHTAV